jgi:hypothetical protein
MGKMQKEQSETFKMTKREVHEPLDYSKYDSTDIVNSTNAVTHAYGITTVRDPRFCRIGVVSKTKSVQEQYFSKKDLKTCFEADLETWGLKYVEIPINYKMGFLNEVYKMELLPRQYVVVLFAKIYADGNIVDYNLLRYDSKGWSEKRYGKKVYYYNDIYREWPSPLQWYETVAAFVINR